MPARAEGKIEEGGRQCLGSGPLGDRRARVLPCYRTNLPLPSSVGLTGDLGRQRGIGIPVSTCFLMALGILSVLVIDIAVLGSQGGDRNKPGDYPWQTQKEVVAKCIVRGYVAEQEGELGKDDRQSRTRDLPKHSLPSNS